jgi:hypothetical protein
MKRRRQMPDDIFKPLGTDKRWRDNPLAVHIRPFVMQLIEDGYAKNTIQSKLWSLADFGRWLGRSRFTVTDVDEKLIKRFVNGGQTGRPPRGNVKTLTQFLDDLRRRNVVPHRKPIVDESALGKILKSV